MSKSTLAPCSRRINIALQSFWKAAQCRKLRPNSSCWSTSMIPFYKYSTSLIAFVTPDKEAEGEEDYGEIPVLSKGVSILSEGVLFASLVIWFVGRSILPKGRVVFSDGRPFPSGGRPILQCDRVVLSGGRVFQSGGWILLSVFYFLVPSMVAEFRLKKFGYCTLLILWCILDTFGRKL